MTACKACGAEILWTVNTKSGRRMPLDAAPADNGNVVLLPGQPLTSMVLAGSALERRQRDNPHEHRFMPHHATCPNADEFRTRRR